MLLTTTTNAVECCYLCGVSRGKESASECHGYIAPRELLTSHILAERSQIVGNSATSRANNKIFIGLIYIKILSMALR